MELEEVLAIDVTEGSEGRGRGGLDIDDRGNILEEVGFVRRRGGGGVDGWAEPVEAVLLLLLLLLAVHLFALC